MPVLAYVLVKVKPGTSHEIVASRKIRGVKMANSVFGSYDAVLVVAAKDMNELSKTIYDVIEKHPNVERTECLISVPYPPEEKPPHHAEHFSVISFQCPAATLSMSGAQCYASLRLHVRRTVARYPEVDRTPSAGKKSVANHEQMVRQSFFEDCPTSRSCYTKVRRGGSCH